MSDSFRPHGLQHVRLPCPLLSPRVCSNLYPLSWWCHPTISSSVAPFSSYSQSFSASGAFPMSQLFSSGGQTIGASTSASVFPMNIQGGFRIELTGVILLLSKGLLSLLKHHSSKASILQCTDFFMVQLSHLDMTPGKTIALTMWTFTQLFSVSQRLELAVGWFNPFNINPKQDLVIGSRISSWKCITVIYVTVFLRGKC